MSFHFDFSATQILWTLTFAAPLVLRVVVLGRDRARRFAFLFTSIVLSTLILLVTRLLYGRMAPIVSSAVFLILSTLAAVIGILVVVEVARRAFAGAARRTWLICTILALFLATVVLVLWGPWPAWSTFKDTSLLGILRMLQVVSDKGSVLVSLLGIELGLLVALYGRRFGAGWQTHPQQVIIGLSAAGLAQIASRALWQFIATHAVIHSQTEYERAIDLRDRIFHGNSTVYLCVLVWWIVWLWRDEPGTVVPAEVAAQDAPDEPAAEQTESSAE